MSAIEVVDYDPSWPQRFAMLRELVWPAVAQFAIAIEHVGSTSVPGLAAKPVIDIDVIVRESDIPQAVRRVADLGYESLGELGIPLRQAFRPPGRLPRHNLYVTAEGCESLRNHLAVRDHLRAHPGDVKDYGELKKRLARGADGNIDCYIAGKSTFIARILSQNGFSSAEVAASCERNAPPPAQLLRLRGSQLDALFAASESGPVPDGTGDGTALIATGTPFAAIIAALARAFAWKGKTFDVAHGRLTNRITPFGVRAVPARVYKAPSRFDGNGCIVLDYSRTSALAHFIRDEIRLLAPGYYLGRVYFMKLTAFRFCLRFRR